MKITELMDKVIRVDELPTYDEVRELIRFIWNREEGVGWYKFCCQNNIYQIFNQEFVRELAKEIEKLSLYPIIETCAGKGKLTYWLRKQGIDIKATVDDYSEEMERDPRLVEKIPNIEALRKYNPKLVIASWIPTKTEPGSQVPMEVLNHPSVKCYIDIGEGPRGCTGTKETWKRKDVRIRYLRSVNTYAISSLAEVHNNDYITDRSLVALFRKK